MANYDNDRAEMEYRKNPPEYAPGQANNDEWNDDAMLGSSSVSDDSAFSGSMVDSVLNNINDNSNNTNTNLNNQNVVNKNDLAATEFDEMVKIAKEIIKACKKGIDYFYNFIEAISESFKNNTSGDWHILGVRVNYVSMGTFSIGLFLLILKPLIPSIGQPQTLMCASCLSFCVGVWLSMNYDRDSSLEDTINDDNVIENIQGDVNNEVSNNDIDISIDDDWNLSDDSEEENSFENDDFNWDDFDSDFIVEEEVEDEVEVELTGIGTDNFNLDESINSINVEQPGIWTRQYLYEMYCKVLPNKTPQYNKMESITTMTDEFMMFSDILRGAAEQVGTKEENLPELEEIRKGLFVIQLRASRPSGLKEQEIADLVANEYSKDEYDHVIHEGVYATVDSRIGVFVINIFTGENAIVTLKDIYCDIKDYILNTDIMMPFVWGIGETGSPYYCDLKDCDSIIISGEGRGGKSWKGQSIVAQLAMYNSPKELEFYVFDHKNLSSDYRYPSKVLPHVRYFCGNGKKICEGLQNLIDVTLKETGKILAENNELNIKDYNRNNPNNKLPYKYVIIDEMQSLMDSYDKDEQAEFRKLTSTIVSKLPYLGLRLILFPHRIVDYVISKNTYSLISSRAVVRQLNEDEVKNAVGVTRKQFPYRLVNMGDMAVRSKEISKGEVVYCHAEVLTMDNDDNKDLFKYIGSVWQKLCPECECITIDERTNIGGNIGNDVCTKLHKNVSKVDHTSGNSEYSYKGYDNENITINTVENLFKDMDDVEEENDESFWEEVLSED